MSVEDLSVSERIGSRRPRVIPIAILLGASLFGSGLIYNSSLKVSSSSSQHPRKILDDSYKRSQNISGPTREYDVNLEGVEGFDSKGVIKASFTANRDVSELYPDYFSNRLVGDVLTLYSKDRDFNERVDYVDFNGDGIVDIFSSITSFDFLSNRDVTIRFCDYVAGASAINNSYTHTTDNFLDVNYPSFYKIFKKDPYDGSFYDSPKLQSVANDREKRSNLFKKVLLENEQIIN